MILSAAMIRRAATLAALLGLAAAPAPAPAEPWVGSLSWTTYLHKGPGRLYDVIDEIDTASLVEVLDCQDGWCRVNYTGSIGYLPRDLLTAAAPPQAAPAPPGPDCFLARRNGYGAGEVYNYCPR